MDRLLSIDEAAEYLGGLSKWTIHAWLGKGKLRKTKAGRRTMLRESDLEAFVSGCNPEPIQATKVRQLAR
jgi:excisionase family DNA binding protein